MADEPGTGKVSVSGKRINLRAAGAGRRPGSTGKIPYLPAVTEALAHARILPTAGDSSTMLTGLQAVLSKIATDPDTDSAALIKSYNESCKEYQFGR